MKLRSPIIAAALVVFAWMAVQPADAQIRRQMTPEDIMSSAKIGQWVEVEGTVQKDYSVFVTEIKFLTGDFLNDDWEINAQVRTVDPEKNELSVLLLPVMVNENTEFDKGIESIKDVKPGMLVELEGTYLKDGKLLANEVENESVNAKEDPTASSTVEVIGKVGKVDERDRVIEVMGIRFKITEQTKGKSTIR